MSLWYSGTVVQCYELIDLVIWIWCVRGLLLSAARCATLTTATDEAMHDQASDLLCYGNSESRSVQSVSQSVGSSQCKQICPF
jgi:hypothetical protein